MTSIGPNLCLSGGAEGSDLMWGTVAGSVGHSVVHWSFRGARSNAPSSEIVELNDAQLREADPYLVRANLTMKRKFPTNSNFVNNLLRRNWYQVKDSESCYAVSTIKNGMVQGGTAWACQLFQDSYNGAPCQCYVFCQNAVHWFKWEGKWEPIYEPPCPSGVWAGVGTRELDFNGKLAIRVLLNYKNCRYYDHLNRKP